MIRNALRLMLVCAVGACTTAPSGTHDPTQGEKVDEIASPSTQAVVPPTPAVFAVPLSGETDAIRNFTTPAGCMAPTTCPDPKSCGTWSTPFECAEECLPQLCQGGAEGVLGRGYSNSFRDCTLLDNSPCREWQLTTFSFCGC
jgi:hypothetical protein